MTSMPSHIEQELRQYCRERNLSEVEFIRLKEDIVKLAKLETKLRQQEIIQKLKNAA